MLGRVLSSGTPTSGCTSRYSLSPAHPALTPWCTSVTGRSGSHQLVQLHDVFGVHSDASVADAHSDAERLVGPMDQVLGKPEIQRMRSQRIVGSGTDDTRQRIAAPGGFFTNRIGRVPGGTRLLPDDAGLPERRLPADPSDADWPCTHDGLALRVVVDPHLRDIDHQTGPRPLGKHEPRRQPDGRPLAGQPHVHPRIGQPKLRKPHPETSRDVEQCVLVPCDVDLVASHDGIFRIHPPCTRMGCRNGNRHGDGSRKQPRHGPPCCRSPRKACTRIDGGRASHGKRIATGHPCRPRSVPGPKISPIREARARRWLFSQGERESGRAGVLDSTSSTLAAFNAAKTVRSASAAGNR